MPIVFPGHTLVSTTACFPPSHITKSNMWWPKILITFIILLITFILLLVSIIVKFAEHIVLSATKTRSFISTAALLTRVWALAVPRGFVASGCWGAGPCGLGNDDHFNHFHKHRYIMYSSIYYIWQIFEMISHDISSLDHPCQELTTLGNINSIIKDHPTNLGDPQIWKESTLMSGNPFKWKLVNPQK